MEGALVDVAPASPRRRQPSASPHRREKKKQHKIIKIEKTHFYRVNFSAMRLVGLLHLGAVTVAQQGGGTVLVICRSLTGWRRSEVRA